MTAIGSLMFCNDCGNLLDSSTSKKNLKLKCDVCGAECKGLYYIHKRFASMQI